MASLIWQSCCPFVFLGLFCGSYRNTINFKKVVAMLKLIWLLNSTRSLTSFEPQLRASTTIWARESSWAENNRLNKYAYYDVAFSIYLISVLMCKPDGDSVSSNSVRHASIYKIILPDAGPVFLRNIIFTASGWAYPCSGAMVVGDGWWMETP